MFDRSQSVIQLMALGFLLLALNACAAKGLHQPTEKIRMTQTEPKGCEYLGEVTGNQGNFFTGPWTSNKNLETGALNDLKNKAANKGANVMVLLTNRAGQTGSIPGGFHQTNVTMTATIFRCETQTSESGPF